MGGDDSQKLLPRRGIHSSPGRKPPAHYEFNTVAENWVGSLPPPLTARSGLSYRRPGSLLASRPGSLLPRAEAEMLKPGPECNSVGASMRPGCFHPRNLPGGCAVGRAGGASMRPGCFHPRNAVDVRRSAALQIASMRPGCFHPRNVRFGGGVGPGDGASMRPGCFHPRNAETPPPAPTPPKLQ